MHKFRKVLFWCHLAVGVTGGVIIFLMSVTGVLLTYERQMSDWADTSTYAVERRDRTSRLGVEAIAARVRETTGHSAARVTLHADPSAPAEIGFDGAASVYVDPVHLDQNGRVRLSTCLGARLAGRDGCCAPVTATATAVP